GTTNVAKAGSAIPVKFTLGGNQGLAIMAAGYPRVISTTCPGTTGSAIEETVTAGNSGLQYDATKDHYTYVWKTERTAGCRVLEVKLKDGSERRAMFQFK
ncbi:MAG TPA: PxKF domain-containing protein, partial [Lysobacter sp.]